MAVCGLLQADHLDDLMAFLQEARRHIGFALKAAQIGEKSDDAKALRGFGGANVLEIIEDFDGDTHRAVYTVRYAEAVYVLHCFQKNHDMGSLQISAIST